MLETREIECFLAVASALHFGRAAEQLHVSTTRVSQTIRGLERRVGAPLLERTSRVVRLTPLGERLLTGLLPAYQQLDQVWREAQQAADSTTLTIGFAASVPTSIQPTIVDAIIGWLPRRTGRRVTPFLSAGPTIRRSAPALLMSKAADTVDPRDHAVGSADPPGPAGNAVHRTPDGRGHEGRGRTPDDPRVRTAPADGRHRRRSPHRPRAVRVPADLADDPYARTDRRPDRSGMALTELVLTLPSWRSEPQQRGPPAG